MDKYSYISNAHSSYIDELYKSYKEGDDTLDESWKKFFEGFEFSQQKYGENGLEEGNLTTGEASVRALIYAYRSSGHLKSDTNPVRTRRDHKVYLELEDHNLSNDDLDKEFEVGELVGLGKTTLKNIVEKLKSTYLGPIGYEFMFIRNPDVVQWFKEQIEYNPDSNLPDLSAKKRILSKLNQAVVFENFLHTKFLGQKRFSLEGGENTIVALDKIINYAAEKEVHEVVIGMAHRGRLNVLANIMGKTYEEIFSEFQGSSTPDQTMGDGDVKYHLGYSSITETTSGKHIYVKLAPNPSHLEAVDPVVLGYTRGQIDDEYRGNDKKAIPVLIHGDAAVAGQGIVYEIVQMSKLNGYSTGGTIHIVINNQVGFTTDYDDARSSIYCTDLAKIVDAPVLHVNGDDAEAVYFASKLAVDYRQKFGGDFFIDLLCYRRHGHNESDEPKFTQPKLYSLIAKHPNPREVYSKKLSEKENVEASLAKELDKEFRKDLQDRLNEVKQNPIPYRKQKLEQEWHSLRKSTPEDFTESPDTSIAEDKIELIGNVLTNLPEGFKPLKQIEKLIKDRKANFLEKKELNWADAELLAYGSLLEEGKLVRMSGQDVRRGTFSHRHSYYFDANNNQPYSPLDNIKEDQTYNFKIFNSLLSEFGVLGFEYGYAMATPHGLIIWEAQFGDFANGAQVIVDQFLSSAETKWQRMNGIVMLLPHGYEGQGPEHSNARPERYLQLAADYNMIVANLTTPANLFHLFRRQLTWEFRKPCIVFSPKSLLRHPKVISPVKDFTESKFKELYDDDSVKSKDVKRVLLCSGKIYYDLLEAREKNKVKDISIVRIEQLHPFPEKAFDAIHKKYKSADFIWVQEEPENMGYWTYMLRTIGTKLNLDIIARKAAASPATGFAKVHKKEQEEIINKALDLTNKK